MSRFGTPAVILAAIVVIGVAFLVRATEPSDEQQLQPFVTTAVFGQTVEGRDLTLRVDDAHLSDRLTTSSWVGATDGVWLVIDATVGSKLGIATPYATLTIGGLQYDSSDRPDDAVLGGSLDAGLPQTGSFVFELPRSVVEGPDADQVRVRFANTLEVQLDSAIDLNLDLTSLPHESSTALQDPAVEIE